MNQLSPWQDTISFTPRKRLSENISTDILIIGGGIAGILCAYELERRNADYMLVTGGTLCDGVTAHTTAKITAQHGLIYDKIIRQYDINFAKAYMEANIYALDRYKKIISETGCSCDFEQLDSYVFSLNNPDIIRQEVYALKRLGINSEFISNTVLPFKIAGAVIFPNQAQFNPLKFLSCISKDLNIYENTFITGIRNNHTAITASKHHINAKKIIIATHFPFIKWHGSYFLKLYQHRSYVIALENAPDLNGIYVSASQNGLSFRNYNNLLLIGGGSHRTGKNGGNFQILREFAKKYYPDCPEKYHFATQDCLSLDSVPYIGRCSKLTPNIFTASGFNKWGMTSSMAASLILADMVMDRPNKYGKIFNPSRNMFTSQLFINAGEAAMHLLSPFGKRCTHMGCRLKWNSAEHTYDCPCHGSRFSGDGSIINNPAMRRKNL